MDRDRLLDNAGAVDALAKRFEESNVGTRGRRGIEAEAEALARALADIEESSVRFLCEGLPRLIQHTKTKQETEEALAEIREELKHIVYHLGDAEFFRGLLEEDWWRAD